VLVKGEWETPEERLAAAERVLAELARLAKGAETERRAAG
jgi:transcription-repair coupling factor (superfamily II helicase)